MIRRTLDILFSVLGLIIFAIPMAGIALIIKLTSPGPAIFKQIRVGKEGKDFEILKFRSMRTSNSGPQITADGDSRITKIGSIIRATKLDELPQLVNILKGDMALVGPRPEVPKYVAQWNPEMRTVILSVRPGVTDPVTVTLRNESVLLSQQPDPEAYYLHTLLPDKVEKYADYIQTRSLSKDFRVILETAVAVIKR